MICKACKVELPDGAKYCYICGRKQVTERRRRVRANGQGTVYKLPNGKWRAAKTIGWEVIPLPPDAPEGAVPKKIQRTVQVSYFRTRTEALNALPTLEQLRRPRRTGDTMTARKGEKITLKELYDQWEPTHDRGKSTINCYRSGFRLFEPLWGLPMSEIDVDDLQECLDDNEVGRRTRENARAALGLCYKYGIPRNCIPKDRNLAQFLRINAPGGGNHVGLSRAELDAIRRLAELGSREARIVLVHCYLGFRPSAFLGLTVEAYNAEERAFVGGIKTAAGKGRTVTVAPKVQPYVDELIAGRSSGPLLMDNGSALNIEQYRAMFYRVIDAAGIDNPVDEQGRHRITPHSCRHTFATLIKKIKAPDRDKLELIGHTSTEQLRYYQDVSYEDLREITDLME